MNKPLLVYLVISPILSALIVIASIFIYVSVVNYTQNLPAFSNMRIASKWKVEYGTVTARVYGRKERTECEFLTEEKVAWAYDSTAKVWREVIFHFVNDNTPSDSKPKGDADFGFWQWQEIKPHYTKVRLVVKHLCGDKIQTSVVGPFDLPKF